MTQPVTGEIWEDPPGAYSTVLPPCSSRVLTRLLRPGTASYVWLVRHMPTHVMQWTEMPVPVFPDGPVRTLQVRGLWYDAQLPLLAFLDLLPHYPQSDGVFLLQMERPVPDTLDYFEIRKSRKWPTILRHFGWMFTVELPFGGEYAQLFSPARTYLEHILADEVIAAGLAAGRLP